MPRILIVDDVKIFRHMEATILGWRGYSVEEAGSGIEALEKARANPPDLMLIDLFMPGMSGHELCRQIKQDERLRSIPIIMVTSACGENDIREAMQAGCDDFISKPLDDDGLLRKVEDQLGESDRRRFARIPASLQVSFEDFKGIFFQYIRDLSRTGVFIEMEDPLPVGACVRLSFSLPEPFRKSIFAYGRIVRREETTKEKMGGVGVRFIYIEEQSRTKIDALVAAQPQLDATHAKGVFSRISYFAEEPSEPGSEVDIRVKATCEELEALRATHNQLRLDHLRLSTLLCLAENVHSAETPQEAIAVASDTLRNLIGISVFGLFLNDSSRSLLIPVASCGLPGAITAAVKATGPLAEAMSQRRLLAPDPPWPVEHTGSKILAAVPLLLRDQAIGVITVFELYPQKAALNANDHHLLEMLGRHLGLALVNATARSNSSKPIDVLSILKTIG